MSCYHPYIGLPTGELTENGKKKYFIRRGSSSRDALYELRVNQDAVMIPCGQCIGCRLDYSRRWADRMMLELETQKKGIFLTLTYNNDEAHWTKFDENGFPEFATLDKRDCQLFMKSLRQHCSRDLGIDRIRFYLAGEYGDETHRPHYHAIIYGLGLSDIKDNRPIGRNFQLDQYYTSPWLEEIWSHGHILFTDVSWKTCAYVARYVTKKVSGDLEYRYQERNQVKEFALMSRKPGIGAEWLDQHPDALDFSSINLSTPQGAVKIPMPHYYLNRLTVETIEGKYNPLYNPEKYDIIKAERRKYAYDNTLLELSKTDLGLSEYLEKKEINKLDSMKKLIRKE